MATTQIHDSAPSTRVKPASPNVDEACSSFRRQSGSCPQKNVGGGERFLSMLAGAALAAYGLAGTRRGSLLATALGGGLIYRGATGHCQTYSMMGISTTKD